MDPGKNQEKRCRKNAEKMRKRTRKEAAKKDAERGGHAPRGRKIDRRTRAGYNEKDSRGQSGGKYELSAAAGVRASRAAFCIDRIMSGEKYADP